MAASGNPMLIVLRGERKPGSASPGGFDFRLDNPPNGAESLWEHLALGRVSVCFASVFPGILSPWQGPVQLRGRQRRLPGIICRQETVKTGYWDAAARSHPSGDLTPSEVQDCCAHPLGGGGVFGEYGSSLCFWAFHTGSSCIHSSSS